MPTSTMRIRATWVGLCAFALFGVSACSTGSSAQQSGETRTGKQAQTAEEDETDMSEEGENQNSEASKTDGTRGKGKTKRKRKRKRKKNKKKKMAQMCPMKVEGTTTSIEKLDEAVAVDFTTPEGDVDELRHRVEKMAERHGEHPGNMKNAAKRKKIMANSTAETEKIEDGVRMKVRPKTSDQMGMLYEHMSKHSEMMAKGKGCPMKMMKGATAGDG